MILIFFSHFMSFNSKACPSFLQGNLLCNAARVMKASTLCTCSESFEQGREYAIHQTLYASCFLKTLAGTVAFGIALLKKESWEEILKFN